MKRPDSGKPTWILPSLLLLAGLAVVSYRPDRPLATIAPGSSSGPTFVVQIIRPRGGLPLGGILPPQLFGLDAHLGFDSQSAGAHVDSVGPRSLELSANGWDLALVLDGEGHLTSESQVVFELVFEEQLRKVRCRPGDPAVGTFSITTLTESDGLSGSFDVELAQCEDATTGAPLGWPQQPLVLHGSFDRLSPGSGAEQR